MNFFQGLKFKINLQKFKYDTLSGNKDATVSFTKTANSVLIVTFIAVGNLRSNFHFEYNKHPLSIVNLKERTEMYVEH